MNKICTSLDQSKKLIELGIDVNTADMYWWSSGKRHYIEAMDDDDFNKESDTPTWSLSALLELIPPYLGEFNEGIDFGLSKAMNGKWYSAYYQQINDIGEITIIKVVTGNTSVDTLFEMVVWLKENGKL